jgi:hypothetical protein
MKFLKQKNISKFGLIDNALAVYDTRRTDIVTATDLGETAGTNLSGGRAVMDISGGLRLPKGTTDQRPRTTGISTPNDGNGYIRYNTTTKSIEALIDNVWEVVRAPGAATVTKQTLGPGDYVQTIFGPLSKIPAAEDNIIVLVENVFQISDTNYNLLYNYLGSGDCYIEFTEAVPLDKNITIYFGFSD